MKNLLARAGRMTEAPAAAHCVVLAWFCVALSMAATQLRPAPYTWRDIVLWSLLTAMAGLVALFLLARSFALEAERHIGFMRREFEIREALESELQKQYEVQLELLSWWEDER